MSNKHRIEPEMRSPKPHESEDTLSDPLLTALDAAEWDDEPYTDEQQALAEAGRQEVLRGETVTLEEVKMQFASHPESRLRASG